MVLDMMVSSCPFFYFLAVGWVWKWERAYSLNLILELSDAVHVREFLQHCAAKGAGSRQASRIQWTSSNPTLL